MVSSVIVIAQIDHPLGIGESIGALFEEGVCLGSCRSRGNGERDAARWHVGGTVPGWRHRAARWRTSWRPGANLVALCLDAASSCFAASIAFRVSGAIISKVEWVG